MKKFALFLILFTAACSSVPAPDGYRMNQYKAPVPSHVPGGKTVDVDDILELKKIGATLIDVVGSGKNLTKGVEDDWVVVKQHNSVPHSIWLPDVGRGALTPAQESYFKKALSNITKNNKAHPLVIYCRENCWLSWNATKRAAIYGYSNLYWFPGGREGWRKAGYELAEVPPYNLR